MDEEFLEEMVGVCRSLVANDPNLTVYEALRLLRILKDGTTIGGIACKMKVLSVMAALGFLYYRGLLEVDGERLTVRLPSKVEWNVKSLVELEVRGAVYALPNAEMFEDALRKRDMGIIYEFSQLPINRDSLMRKFAFMQSFQDVDGKEMIFVGDDDFLSVTCSLLGRPKRVVVVDLDERLLEGIGELSKKYGLDIETFKHNLVHPLPEELQGSFDTFCTDSPHCLGGILLFVSRGASALKQGTETAGYFVFQTVNEPLLMEFETRQKLLRLITNEMNGVIQGMLPASIKYITPRNEDEKLMALLLEATKMQSLEEYYRYVKKVLKPSSKFIEFYPEFSMEASMITRVVFRDPKPLIEGEYDKEAERRYGPIYSWTIIERYTAREK
ncbi:MAG: bis-aminopropyl spermidine synthase family protein [Candidatus Freyarchaeota archaeon]|nr:bis-aminopropyl spermidine synthase family protein [Candidatus Jordarchaeia archaeon]